MWWALRDSNPPRVARRDPQGAYSTWGPQWNIHRASLLLGAPPL